jgi:flagellar hook-length control protein FliK
MSLNISTQSMNNFQGNNSIKDISSSKGEFESVFGELRSIDEEIGLETDKDDIEDVVDNGLLQNILNNIGIMDLRESINFKKDKTSFLDEVDSDSTNQLDLLKGISNLLKQNELYNTNTNNQIKLENNAIYDFIKQNMQMGFDHNEISNAAYEFIKQNSQTELDDNTISNAVYEFIKQSIGEGESTNVKDILDNKKSNIENELKQEINKLDGYKQLEISSLYNKSNVLQNTVSSTNLKDKDLDTLESILDINDRNDFTFQNNNLNAINTQTSKDNVSSEAPVTTIKQEFIGEDVVKTVKYLKSNGLEEIKIKISPRELGDMTIKLIKNHEETKVLITISKEDVFDMVNKKIGDITKHLNDLNINVKEVSVDIKSDNKNFFSDNLSQEFNKKNHQNKKKRTKYEDAEIETIEEIKESNRVEENIDILI